LVLLHAIIKLFSYLLFLVLNQLPPMSQKLRGLAERGNWESSRQQRD